MPTVFDRYAVLKPDLLLDELDVSPEIYQELDQRYKGFHAHTLISAHQFSEDWPTWEKHPAGDEMVVLLSGQAEFLLRRESDDESIFYGGPRRLRHCSKEYLAYCATCSSNQHALCNAG